MLSSLLFVYRVDPKDILESSMFQVDDCDDLNKFETDHQFKKTIVCVRMSSIKKQKNGCENFGC